MLWFRRDYLKLTQDVPDVLEWDSMREMLDLLSPFKEGQKIGR